jgi:hypothetical protein
MYDMQLDTFVDFVSQVAKIEKAKKGEKSTRQRASFYCSGPFFSCCKHCLSSQSHPWASHYTERQATRLTATTAHQLSKFQEAVPTSKHSLHAVTTKAVAVAQAELAPHKARPPCARIIITIITIIIVYGAMRRWRSGKDGCISLHGDTVHACQL